MPSRLSASPPTVPRGSSSPQEMSLTASSRLIPEPHLLHPPSYLSEAPSRSTSNSGVFNISDLALPPLQSRQSYGQYHTAYRQDSERTSYIVHRGQKFLAAAPGLSSIQNPYGTRLQPINSTPPNLVADSSPQIHLLPSQGKQIIKEEWRPDTLKDSFADSDPSQRSSRQDGSPETFSAPKLEYRRSLSELKTPVDDSRSYGTPSQIGSENLSPTLQYDIIIRQQPRAARACGFGERDRRVVDPPPILEIIIRDPAAAQADITSKLRYPLSVVHCELWSAYEDVVEGPMTEAGERRQQRKLMGTLVASPFVGCDEFGVEGCFFPFPDLSCRTIGRYRLKFVLVNIDPARMKPGDRLPFKATVLSDIFEVYTAKTFPGMIKSTALTMRLKEQGCLISVKKGHQRHQKRKAASGGAENEEDDEDVDVEISEREQEKKLKI